jgi:DNA-binding HxlR family transcriptional regulator
VSEAVSQDQGEGDTAIAELLRLLGEGAAGAILLALGDGPMQTKVLTHRVRGYTARTIYRYLPKLARLGVVERNDEPSGPAKVVNTLTPEAGSALCAVVDRFAQASQTRLPGGQVESGTWGSLGLLADLWEAGVMDELSRGPRSPTDLVQIRHGLSYHQVSRRAGQFKATGFLGETERSGSRQRRYVLTEKARRTMGLIAAISHWRHRHGVSGGAGLSVEEMATVLRVSLPLAEIPQHAGKVLQVQVVGDGEEAAVWAQANDEGRIETYDAQPARSDATAAGDLETWLAAIVGGGQLTTANGDEVMVRDCLADVYARLWTPSPF